jgi:hypothetical protein
MPWRALVPKPDDTPVSQATAEAIERMARAGADDSLPDNGMFNEFQLGAMRDERLPTYRRIAEVMLVALFKGGK